MRWIRLLAACALALLMGACAAPSALHQDAGAASEAALLIVAVRDDPEPTPGAGATPRANYRLSAGYAGSTRSAALSADVAREHGLVEQAFWTIDPLHLRCTLYRLQPGDSLDAALARLKQDPRVQLAQPLNQFGTLGEPAYNDPYFTLQHGFKAMGAAQAQLSTRGEGVTVALIDTSVDGGHPDLAGRVVADRDFVDAIHPRSLDEKHGTEMAGVIAATANNRLGIVGIAPEVRLLAYRACWAVPTQAGASRCDTFTLAQALGAAITAKADIINLSLGGPADPLLEQLTGYALQRGAVVVAAVPPGGRLDGFPLKVPGVIAVAPDDDAPADPRVLSAPGRDVLTLTPGGHYDYASGGSLAAAHVTGAIALLRALNPRLRAGAALSLLQGKPGASGTNTPRRTLDLCAAVRQLKPETVCTPAIPRD